MLRAEAESARAEPEGRVSCSRCCYPQVGQPEAAFYGRDAGAMRCLRATWLPQAKQASLCPLIFLKVAKLLSLTPAAWQHRTQQVTNLQSCI